MWLHISLAFAPSGHFITCNACLWEKRLWVLPTKCCFCCLLQSRSTLQKSLDKKIPYRSKVLCLFLIKGHFVLPYHSWCLKITEKVSFKVQSSKCKKLVKIPKLKKFKCDILSNFQTMLREMRLFELFFKLFSSPFFANFFCIECLDFWANILREDLWFLSNTKYLMEM